MPTISTTKGHCLFHPSGCLTNPGHLTFTPALVTSLQVSEVCKLVLGRGALLRNRKLVIDLLDMEFHEIANETPP